jgi:hypothetical protein
MASAVREAIRTPVRMESKNVRDQHLDAGERTVSPALRRLHRVKVAQGPGDWLAGFNAGLRGDVYIYPANVQDRPAWSAGFQRLQRLARIQITPPSFAPPLWWHP